MVLTVVSGLSFAQIGLKPLESNPTLISYKKAHPDYVWNSNKKLGKWGTPDTLEIPFFEDFTSTLMYPDSSRWQDNFVFVNRDFGVNPPSYGVATFDFLDENGKPYSSIEKESVAPGDTLTSQFINLKDSSGNQYTPGDSFYLSFFYQARGRGDLITPDDSFKLQLRDADGNWNQVWGIRGRSNYDFNQVLIPIKDAKYLHIGFQFRFINITHRWGNNNHWHLDYIYLNKNRNDSDVYYNDYAIQSKPTSLLKNFYSMPYDHFLADQSEAADTFFFTVSNLNDKVINAQVRHVESHMGNNLVSTSFADNAANVPSQGEALRRVKGYDFTGLNGYPIVIDRKYYVKESGVVNPVLFQVNDYIDVPHTFTRHYAYDDGTAESGFGFNDLKTDYGQVVIEFDLKKDDTLRAVDILLTYNTQDVGRERFDFQIWRDIDFNGGTDDLIYERNFLVEDIYDAIDNRGFYTIGLDSPILLTAGKFYVGWRQEREYNLTVGFDKNNGYLKNANQTNTHIFFDIGDGWIQNSNKDLVGAPMIRPIVGQEDPFIVGLEHTPKPAQFTLYPNPTDGVVYLPGSTQSYRVLDMGGRLVANGTYTGNALNLAEVKSGIYTVQIVTKQNERLNAKLIKL